MDASPHRHIMMLIKFHEPNEASSVLAQQMNSYSDT